LIEAVPELRRWAALADSTTMPDAKLHALQEAAHARNIELSIHWIARPEEIPAAIDAAKASGAAALNVLASPLLSVNDQVIVERVAANGRRRQREAVLSPMDRVKSKFMKS
jgi:hypothetical protein